MRSSTSCSALMGKTIYNGTLRARGAGHISIGISRFLMSWNQADMRGGAVPGCRIEGWKTLKSFDDS
jgi:hypothetical protein